MKNERLSLLEKEREMTLAEVETKTKRVSELELEHVTIMRSLTSLSKKKSLETKSQQKKMSMLKESLIEMERSYQKETTLRETLSVDITNVRLEHRRSLTQWKERQKTLTDALSQQKNQFLMKTQEFQQQSTKLVEKVRWCQTREENKIRGWYVKI